MKTVRRAVLAAVVIALAIAGIVHFTEPSGYQKCVTWLIKDMQSGSQSGRQATSAPPYCTSLTRSQQEQAGKQALQEFEKQVRNQDGF